MAEHDNDSSEPTSAASRLFDIRLLIGGLFCVYGVLLTVDGFFTSSKDRDKAAGININLWLGLGMLALGLLFMLWLRLRPLVRPDPADTADSADPADRPSGGH